MKTYTKTNPKAFLLLVLLVPVVAISLASCSLCGVDGDEEGVFIKKPYIFGKGGAARYAEEVGVDLLGEVPIIQDIMQGADDGVPAVNTVPQVAEVYQQVARKVVDKMKEMC